MTQAKESTCPAWLTNPMVIDSRKWIPGSGPIPAEWMIVGERPGDDEIRIGAAFSGPAGELLHGVCLECGINTSKAYITNAVKYGKVAAIDAGDLKLCKPLLEEEIKRVNPKLILCLGAHALKAVAGRQYKLSEYRGEFIPHPERPNTQVYVTYNPAYILRNPDAMATFRQDFKQLGSWLTNGFVQRDETQYTVIHKLADLIAFRDTLLQHDPNPLISLDCEWNGVTWMAPDRYTRTVQLGWTVGHAAIVELRDAGGAPMFDDEAGCWRELKAFLEDPRVGVFGQHVISDGLWLLPYGIDIRERVVYDTMLAEAVLNETGPFGLEELTCKYTNMGRYDVPLQEWKNNHKKECVHGFGPIPREILLPYAAKDVDATRRIMLKQAPLLVPFAQARGTNKQYPSLWQMTLLMQKLIYELETTGMLVDQVRLKAMIDQYSAKLGELEAQLKVMAAQVGLTDFNCNSPDQVRDLLFQKLQLQPIKTTKNKEWSMDSSVGVADPSSTEEDTPSTDKTTLEILEDAHPAVKVLAQVRRVSHARKNWLCYPKAGEDEQSKGGGVLAKIWPDGRIHAKFSQLAETGRWRSKQPNVQNWPKKAEGYLAKIFGKDNLPPLLRSVVVPTPGYLLMEGDFVQAELFVLAALSDDDTMWEALTTPGKDMHDKTAIDAFHLQVMLNDQPVVEREMLALAKSDKAAFEKLQKQFVYLSPKGDRLVRDAFKNGIRVSAKNLNFGRSTTYATVCRSKIAELSGKPYGAIRTEGCHIHGQPGAEHRSCGNNNAPTRPRHLSVKRCADPLVRAGSRIKSLDILGMSM